MSLFMKNTIDPFEFSKQSVDYLSRQFLDLNDIRRIRSMSRLTQKQQQFLLALPLFFHVNHPQFPGFIGSDCPAGIAGYELDKTLVRLAKAYAKNFVFNRGIIHDNAIDALFAMGSVGSIAHNLNSDFDLWLCYADTIDDGAKLKLEKKTIALSEWAEKNLHLEVHIFLMPSDYFVRGINADISLESSGSAQHYLLLDEFYRSSIYLAGKTPAWWYVPASEEKNYSDYLARLYAHRFIDRNKTIDFGPIAEIPAEEFVGAGCWQLFKAIESPYKSFLKLALLEVYAARLDETHAYAEEVVEPLALTFKREVYKGVDANAVDTYLLLYKKIERYLLASCEEIDRTQERLDILRRAFYIKIGTPYQARATSTDAAWQYDLIRQLIIDWQWPSSLARHLDNRIHWKAKDVIDENARLVKSLNRSYRLLSNLSRQLELSMAIKLDELTILSRKLHTAFERKAGKIERINPSISQDLAEPALTFSLTASDQGAKWSLYACDSMTLELSPQLPAIRHARSLIELILFAKINGILVQGTRLDLRPTQDNFSSFYQKQMLSALSLWLQDLPSVDHRDFMMPNSIDHVLVMVNAHVEPHAQLHKMGLQRLSNLNDPFGFSGFRENLVRQMDVVQRSNWGELVVRPFSGQALHQSLLFWLRVVAIRPFAQLPTLSVECFSLGKGGLIAERIRDLWMELARIFHAGSEQKAARYCLEVGEAFWLIQFIQGQPQILRFSTLDELFSALGQAQSRYSEIIVDRYAQRLSLLSTICRVKRRGDIQIFYHAEDASSQATKAMVYVVDECGSLIRLYSEVRKQPVFLRPLFGFIRNTLQYQKSFSEAASEYRMDPASIYELSLAAGPVIAGAPKFSVARKHLDKSLLAEPYIRIKAVADVADNGDVIYSIYCNEQEFSVFTYGEQLFHEVANYVVSLRPSKEPYPCYITELDLSACSGVVGQGSTLSLAEYLKIKQRLESKINFALLASVDAKR